jgi:hypothetical protein
MKLTEDDMPTAKGPTGWGALKPGAVRAHARECKQDRAGVAGGQDYEMRYSIEEDRKVGGGG